MARSVWKGPFVEESLIKKVDKEKNNPKSSNQIIDIDLIFMGLLSMRPIKK